MILLLALSFTEAEVKLVSHDETLWPISGPQYFHVTSYLYFSIASAHLEPGQR